MYKLLIMFKIKIKKERIQVLTMKL